MYIYFILLAVIFSNVHFYGITHKGSYCMRPGLQKQTTWAYNWLKYKMTITALISGCSVGVFHFTNEFGIFFLPIMS